MCSCPQVKRLVDMLNRAGVRFTLLSEVDEPRGRKLARDLGLETGWNCDFSLSEEIDANADVAEALVGARLPRGARAFIPRIERSQLPRGVSRVRWHLENKDDVPLLVQRITECTPAAVAEMVKITQEYGDVTCVVGSSLNPENASAWSQADCAVDVWPMLPPQCGYASGTLEELAGEEDLTAFDFSTRLSQIPCAIHLNYLAPMQARG
jgi:hypothetical protein